MDDDAAKRDSTVYVMGLLALAGCGVAILASGGIAVFALATAIACLAGSIAASLVERRETGSEWDTPEVEENPIIARHENRVVSTGHEVEAGRSWSQVIAAARQTSRHR